MKYAIRAALLCCVMLSACYAAPPPPIASGPLPEQLPTLKAGESRTVTDPSGCIVQSCGIPVSTSCSIQCRSDQTPYCSCDCTDRALGVCTELKANCVCEKSLSVDHLPGEVQWATLRH